MSDVNDRLEVRIREAFQDTPAPRPDELRDSDEGDEPLLLEAEFRHVPDWRQVDVAFIDRAPDGFGTALYWLARRA